MEDNLTNYYRSCKWKRMLLTCVMYALTNVHWWYHSQARGFSKFFTRFVVWFLLHSSVTSVIHLFTWSRTKSYGIRGPEIKKKTWMCLNMNINISSLQLVISWRTGKFSRGHFNRWHLAMLKILKFLQRKGFLLHRLLTGFLGTFSSASVTCWLCNCYHIVLLESATVCCWTNCNCFWSA